MMHSSWTPEIVDLVGTLTCRVRVLSLGQIHRGWGLELGGVDAVNAIVHRLIESGMVVGEVWNAPPSPVADKPLIAWSPGSPHPNVVELETIVQERWGASPKPTPVVAATHRASRLFGSSAGGFPPANHQNHDLLLSEVYVQLRLAAPATAAHWIGEDAMDIAERGVKNPDAFIVDEEGDVIRVIESAGKYSQEQLESFHQHCKSAGLPYELW